MSRYDAAKEIRLGLKELGRAVGSGVSWAGFWIALGAVLSVAIYTGQVTL